MMVNNCQNTQAEQKQGCSLYYKKRGIIIFTKTVLKITSNAIFNKKKVD